MIRDLAGRTWVHVLTGGLLMGSWAVFANRMHDTSEAIQAGALQALLSAFLTGCLKMIADRLLTIVPHWALAAALSLAFSATLLISAHWATGTPEIGATVTVPLLVSGTYIFAYCFLRRSSV